MKSALLTKPSTFSSVSELIEYALLAEVSTTPKPGLVDLHDNGAHKDMCADTFAASTRAIVPYLVQMMQLGADWQQADGSGLFAAIRPIGVEAERAMFRATGGVNTHKGMIFSMGIAAAVSGWYYRHHGSFRPEEILNLAGQLCHDLLEKDFQKIDRNHPKTHGEILFVKYGAKGIRGEVQKGFPSIRKISLPALRHLKANGASDNEAYLNTLLTLMAHVDDTNVLIRTSFELLTYEKSEAVRLLSLGGACSDAGLRALAAANEDFIEKNLSPGGCADLLAVTIFLWELEKSLLSV